MIITHTGQRVQPKYCPEHRGTVTRIVHGRSFRVSYDSHGRRTERPVQPRTRVDFRWDDARLFEPAGTEEIRYVDSGRIELPADLAKKYGIGED